jgi:hypothetical protein
MVAPRYQHMLERTRVGGKAGDSGGERRRPAGRCHRPEILTRI